MYRFIELMLVVQDFYKAELLPCYGTIAAFCQLLT